MTTKKIMVVFAVQQTQHIAIKKSHYYLVTINTIFFSTITNIN